MPAPITINLSDPERKELKKAVSSSLSPVRLVKRAQAILMAADHIPSYQIASELGVSSHTVGRWRRCYAEQRMAGIVKDRPRGANQGGKKTADQEKLRQAIIQKTTQDKPPGATHWSTRMMAKALGTTHSFVNRVWQEAGLKPHLHKTFKVSNDPHFEQKLRDVVGLYMNPPEKAVVFCVDEKSSIQALDRTQPGLPMKKGRCGTMTHDYKRHGTSTLFAALNAATGEVIGTCKKRHRHEEFLCFLKEIEKRTPKELTIHIIVDNYATHKHQKVRNWLKRTQRVQLHFTPTSSSWLNLVERFLGLLTDKALRRGVFTSVKELEKTIQDFVAQHNDQPKPFVWTKSANKILEKVNRARQNLLLQNAV
ncbi:MAG: IS630 family transposase [Gammaproteobacteria bacterium]|nr:IS630 family transposase [Gammaproteobacteria bacterium]NKB65397.1 IS630 family transposase [Gammaproteobacteria bacterium]